MAECYASVSANRRRANVHIRISISYWCVRGPAGLNPCGRHELGGLPWLAEPAEYVARLYGVLVYALHTERSRSHRVDHRQAAVNTQSESPDAIRRSACDRGVMWRCHWLDGRQSCRRCVGGCYRCAGRHTWRICAARPVDSSERGEG